MVVRVTNALVTGKGSNGFFVQVKQGDAGYQGPEYSGLMVFTGASAPTLANATVGLRVTIDGRVASFQGQLELDSVAAVTATTTTPEAAPAPVATTYAEIKTGGTLAAKLEGVLVSLGGATVTATDAMFGEVTLTAGADTLIADDFVYTPSPMPLPSIGTAFTGIRGILALRQMASKLEPRGAADLISGAPTIASLSPALSFARAGQTAAMPTFPAPLTITLTGPAQGATTVTVTSGDPAALTVTDVTIPDGATTGVVDVTALAQSAAVPVTATLGGTMKTAMVRVLDAAEVPSTVTLSPPTATVAAMGSVQFTVTLDVPAPAGGTVVGLAATSGTVPPTVTVPADQLSATFTYTDTAGSGSATVTATLGGSTSNATVTVSSAAMHLVISQVYGGGGNSGAPLANDFVELHNPGPTSLSLAGMSVQYASAAGTSWLVTALPSLTVPPGGYVLIQGASGGANGAPLPTPDATGTTNMSATAGKVALVNSATALSGACPTANVVDFVGYGSTATCSETAPGPAGSNTAAVRRGQNGCVDSDNNSADFMAGAPTPRNSAAAAAVCP
ncbi:MAG TPA: lamin tail domain-containing protein [Kofleriaceae bacterium]|nr:lamin tail domain-containing protein [Kofleriaceae bacterium]